MIIDHRTYNVKPGRLNECLKLYEEEAFPLQSEYLGHCVGWYTSNDIGPLNQVVHMWAFKDLNDRADRRARMLADPAWGRFLANASDGLVNMENKMLRRTPFFTPPEMNG